MMPALADPGTLGCSKGSGTCIKVIEPGQTKQKVDLATGSPGSSPRLPQQSAQPAEQPVVEQPETLPADNVNPDSFVPQDGEVLVAGNPAAAAVCAAAPAAAPCPPAGTPPTP